MHRARPPSSWPCSRSAPRTASACPCRRRTCCRRAWRVPWPPTARGCSGARCATSRWPGCSPCRRRCCCRAGCTSCSCSSSDGSCDEPGAFDMTMTSMFDHEDLRRRIERELIDGYDEELEMEIEDRVVRDPVAGDGPVDHLADASEREA